MVQPLLQDHPTNTWGTCLVPRVQGLVSRRCSNLHGHHSFSSQRHRWRVLFHQGLHFRLISDSSCPLMQYQGNLIMHPVCHSHSLFCQLALVLKRRGQTHSSLITLNSTHIQHSKGICYYEILVSENYMPAFDNWMYQPKLLHQKKLTHHHFFFSKADILLLAYLTGSQPAQPTSSDAATSTNNQEASGPVTSNSDPNTSN
jgi:hypothetical protein